MSTPDTPRSRGTTRSSRADRTLDVDLYFVHQEHGRTPKGSARWVVHTNHGTFRVLYPSLVEGRYERHQYWEPVNGYGTDRPAARKLRLLPCRVRLTLTPSLNVKAIEFLDRTAAQQF